MYNEDIKKKKCLKTTSLERKIIAVLYDLSAVEMSGEIILKQNK